MTPTPPKMNFSFAPMKLRPAAPAPSGPQDARLAALMALVNQGRLAEAEASARALVASDPGHGMGWKTLAAVLLAQDKDGLEASQRAVACLPQDAQAVCNLGRAWHDRQHLPEAIQAYRQALSLRPGLLQALLNLGAALRDSGDLAGSEATLVEATRLHPTSADAFNDLGLTLTAAGQLDAAYRSLQQALTLRPDFVMAMFNLARALRKGRRFDLAASVFDRVLAIAPEDAKAHLGRGSVLRDLGLMEEAVEALERAVSMQPGLAEAHYELGLCQVEQGDPVAGLASYARAQAIDPNDRAVLPSMMFARQYLPDPNPRAWLDEARAYGAAARAGVPAYRQWKVSPEPQRRLRIGLVSGDLRQHPVGYFLESALHELVRQQADALTFVAYHNFVTEDELSARLRPLCQAWHQVADWNDERLAQQIHGDAIDILIDLAGHTTHNRVPTFVWRPAPVQLSWLGYFATTGIAEMDYLLADPYTVPPEHEAHFTETIWRLPHTRMCFTAPKEDVPVSPLPAQAAGHITFGCFNHVGKYNDQVLAAWSRILHGVPGSRLLLKAKQLSSPATRERLLRSFADHGIGAERLELLGPSGRRAYLETYHRVDIGLDPFPYTGGTTTAESLWMGVPVITQYGASMVSRQGLGLLVNAGLPDWTAPDTDAYVKQAIALAADTAALATLRSRLRAQVLVSPLFDASAFARHFEAALRGMWQRWCERA